MFYKNARIFTSDFQFVKGAFEVTEDGKFGAVLPENVPADAIDLQGATVIPGLIDVHNHGNSGEDFSDGNYEGLVKMAQYLLKSGITSFAPASLNLDIIPVIVVPLTIESSTNTILLSFTADLFGFNFIPTSFLLSPCFFCINVLPIYLLFVNTIS